MKVVIFAGGNQTRFGKTIEEQSKVLYPIKGVPLLSHTLKELDACGLEEIIVRVWNKSLIKNYINSIKSEFSTPIVIDERDIESAGGHVFESREEFPALIIFGDGYFPNGYLCKFVSEVNGMENIDAVVATTPYHVGDSNVVIENNLVAGILKEGNSPYFTCGLFAVLNHEVLNDLERSEKVANIFAQIVEKGHRVGCVILGEGVADLDTLEIASSLKA